MQASQQSSLLYLDQPVTKPVSICSSTSDLSWNVLILVFPFLSLVPPALLPPVSFVFFPTFSATGLEVVAVADAFHVRLFTTVLTEVGLIRNVTNVSPCYSES